MAIGDLAPPHTERLTSFSTTTVYVPFTDWGPAVGVDVITAAILVNAVNAVGGSTLMELAIQTAAVRVDAPDAWALVTSGPQVTNAGSAAASALSVSTQTGARAWVRWGIAFTGATPPSAADVTLTVATVSKGMALGTWRGQLTSVSNTDSILAVTGWVPAAWAQHVYAAIVTAGCGAATTFKARLVYRTAIASKDVVGAWTNTSDAGPSTGGNGDRIVIDSTYTPGAVMWVQFGIAYVSTSGTSVAEVAVSVFGRRA